MKNKEILGILSDFWGMPALLSGWNIYLKGNQGWGVYCTLEEAKKEAMYLVSLH